MKVVSVLFNIHVYLFVSSTMDDMAFKVINGVDDSLERISARILHSPVQLSEMTLSQGSCPWIC